MERQPMPTEGQQIVLNQVFRDILDRAEMGFGEYGHYLQTHNGRSAAVDTYHELLDAVLYFKQLMIEVRELERELERLRGLVQGMEK